MLADDHKVELPGLEHILIYRDSADSGTFYYTSTRPAVATQAGEYQMTLLRYDQPYHGQAALLSFVVELEPPPEDVQAMGNLLLQQNPHAQWKPMPWTSGGVAAAFIGSMPVQSTPSLFNRNSAVISMTLSTEQYLLFRTSLQGGSTSPISIVYRLNYSALRSAYSFHISFDQSKFREWVRSKCTVGLLFISFETVKTFEELRRNGVIRVMYSNQTEEAPPDGFQRAFLRSLQSVLTPMPQFTALPGEDASSWQLGFSCSKISDTQSITSSYDSSMQVSAAVARSVFLQGALSNLFEAYEARPEIVIPTRGQFKQKLQVRCHAHFTESTLRFMSVRFSPKGLSVEESLCHTFDCDHMQDWTLELIYSPQKETSYIYECGLHFADPEKTRWLPALDIDRDRVFLDITPEEFYTFRQFTVSAAEDFPWDLIRSVAVRMEDQPAGMRAGSLHLHEKQRTGTLEVFSASLEEMEEHPLTVTYTPLNGSRFFQTVLPVGSTVFLNPFRRRTVMFRMAETFDWTRFSKARIALKVPAAGMLVGPSGLRQITMQAGSAPVRYICWYTDGDNRNLWYRTSLAYADGSAAPQSEWQEASEPVVKIHCPEPEADVTSTQGEIVQ